MNQMNSFIKLMIMVILWLLIMNSLYMLVKTSIHPMIMLFNLLFFTLTNTLMASKWFYSYFISYLMFLVFIGGILITFMYLVSLTNKDKYNIKLLKKEKYLLLTTSSLALIFLILPFLSLEFISTIPNNNEFIILPPNNNCGFLPNLLTCMMYTHAFKVTIISVMILLFILISVIKICSKHAGPLRQVKKKF